MRRRRVLLILCLLIGAACQPAAPAAPTSAPTATAAPALAQFPTREPRAVATRALPTAPPTATPFPTLPPPTPGGERLLPASPLSVQAAVSNVTYGYSVEGRALHALRLGEGERVLILVGGMHGGWEANTVALVEALAAHFEAHPEDIAPGMSLVLVAVANPDGLPHGRSEAGRFNASGVDLNRNWGCEWSAEAVWRSQRVHPGVSAFSEPETRALAEYIRALRPAAVLFYHSAANGVYAGDCESDTAADSEALAAVVGEAAGYRYGQPFSAYTVTGTAPNWVDGLGIPSADVELRTWTDAEFEANLRGVLAAQRWLRGN